MEGVWKKRYYWAGGKVEWGEAHDLIKGMEYSKILYTSPCSTVGSGNPHPSIYVITLLLTLLAGMNANTCTRYVAGSRYKQNHSTLCSKTQGMSVVRQPSDTTHYWLLKFQASVCQAWVHILHEDLKETTKCHLIAELKCPTKTVTNRCHVNFHKWYGSLSNAVQLTQVVRSYD